LLKSDDRYPTFNCGFGGGGGGLIVAVIQGDRSVEKEIRTAFLWAIVRISNAERGHVKVWKGSTVGADGIARF